MAPADRRHLCPAVVRIEKVPTLDRLARRAGDGDCLGKNERVAAVLIVGDAFNRECHQLPPGRRGPA